MMLDYKASYSETSCDFFDFFFHSHRPNYPGNAFNGNRKKGAWPNNLRTLLDKYTHCHEEKRYMRYIAFPCLPFSAAQSASNGLSVTRGPYCSASQKCTAVNYKCTTTDSR